MTAGGVEETSDWKKIDFLFLAGKLKIYQELEKNHLEDALYIVRRLIRSVKNIAQKEDDALISLVRNAYIHWLRANYFHLVTDRAKALDNYSHALAAIEGLRQNEERNEILASFLGKHDLFEGLISADLGDFHWYSGSTDLASVYYERAKAHLLPGHLPKLDEKEVEWLRPEVSALERGKYVETGKYGKGGTSASDVANISEAWPQFIALKQLYMSTRCRRTQRIAVFDAESELKLFLGKASTDNPFIPFLVGQQCAMLAAEDGKQREKLYLTAMRYFLATMFGQEVPCPNYLFERAPLEKIVNSGLLKRAASYYLLCKLLRQLPLDENGFPSRNRENDSQVTPEWRAELDQLGQEIRDFIAAVDRDPELVALLEFLRQAREWVISFRELAKVPQNETVEDKRNRLASEKEIRRKVAYIVSNTHFFLHDFVNRKRDFEGDVAAKLFTPAINIVPRSGNVFSVLRRWNSASPVIMRTRKVAVTLKNENRPEDLRMGADLKCHADYHPESKGGGYFLRWNGYGIVIDPGIFFFENFLEYYSVADINLVVISHDHPDHSMDVKSLFMLLSESAQEGKSRAPIDFWIDPASCSEFYAYILNLHSKEEMRAQEEEARGVSSDKRRPRLIGNVWPYYKDETPDQNSPNKKNVWWVDGNKGIELRTIYNKKHKTITLPQQSFGVLLSLYSPDDNKEKRPEKTLYITGDGGFDENTISSLKAGLRHSGAGEKLDILVAHMGSIHDGDLTDTRTFSGGIYKTHLGMRGVVELIDRLKPGLTIISEFGEELDTFRKRFCRMVDLHRLFISEEAATIQSDVEPRAVLPGDVGLTLWLDKPPSTAVDWSSGKTGFVCRLCFHPHKLDELKVHTSGQVLFMVCKECEEVLFQALESGVQGEKKSTQELADDLLST